MSDIQQLLTEKEVIELHKKVYNLLSKRWHETIYGAGDYEPIVDSAPEYIGLQKKIYSSGFRIVNMRSQISTLLKEVLKSY
ncbi:MAG: hypothetical protein LUH15_10130 [Tannerellaceae bacterium]|nr:hypothetical protein [Tannerellaceae bacterium]